MIDVQIGSHYPERWSRRDPWGLALPAVIEGLDPSFSYIAEVSMEGDGAGPFATLVIPKGHITYRGLTGKPFINGEWWPLVKVKTADGYPVAQRRGPHQVTVTEDAVVVPPTPPLVPFQIRATFYYGWFNGHDWGGIPIKATPSLGRYDQNDPDTLAKHVDALEYGKFDAAIISWWGPNDTDLNDKKVGPMLEAVRGRNVKLALYYEQEGTTNPPVEKIRSDLAYIRERYASHPNFLKIDGKFVVFVYTPNDSGSCEVMERWKAANQGDVFVVPGAVASYLKCPNQPDGWHEYNPVVDVATTFDVHGRLYSFNISPGFHFNKDEKPRLKRDVERFRRNVRDMIASQAPWQLVTSFNEWIECSSVESAEEWKTPSGYGAYLDALHTNGIERNSP